MATARDNRTFGMRSGEFAKSAASDKVKAFAKDAYRKSGGPSAELVELYKRHVSIIKK